MKKKILIAIIVIAVIGGGVVIYMYNLPHRDVHAATADETLDATELVNSFLNNREEANKKYLSDDGESKILIVSGRVESIIEDQLGQKVVLLKEKNAKMGVSCTFTLETANEMGNITLGDVIQVKGVIRAGAEFDEDLDLAEDAILEKCSIAK